MTEGAFPVALDCMHTVLYLPKPELGDVVYCASCAEYREVTDFPAALIESARWTVKQTRVDMWQVRCHECDYYRAVRGTEEEATSVADNHLTTKHQQPVITERPVA